MLQRVHVVHEVVAGRAVATPRRRQELALHQDLLDHDVRSGRISSIEPLAQSFAIVGRVGETIDMVDPDAVDHALGIEERGQGMHPFEGLGILHAQADQLVDVEEAPPVDAIARGPPPGEPVWLGLEQRHRQRAFPLQRQDRRAVAQATAAIRVRDDFERARG